MHNEYITMEITKGELVDLYLGLNTLGELQGAKFAYAVMRNVNALKAEAEAILSAKEPKADYIAFERAKLTLAKSQTVVKDGVPQTYEDDNGGKFYAVADPDKFNKDFEELKKAHQPAIDNYTKQLKEVEDILKEKVEVTLYKMPVDYLPENISVKQLAVIDMIVEHEDVKA